jgi:hypothetical protein
MLSNQTPADTVREWLATASSVTVLTGAGISAESGIPTFRGPYMMRNARIRSGASSRVGSSRSSGSVAALVGMNNPNQCSNGAGHRGVEWSSHQGGNAPTADWFTGAGSVTGKAAVACVPCGSGLRGNRS